MNTPLKSPPVDLTESAAGEEDPGSAIDMATDTAGVSRPPAAPGGDVCPECGGSGQRAGRNCAACGGTGKARGGAGGA